MAAGPWLASATANGLKVEHTVPRFYVFLTMAPRRSHMWRHVNVVELRPPGWLPTSIRSRQVKQILLRTPPLPIHSAIETHHNAERVIEKLKRMTLSLQVADLEQDGVKQLFDHLWNLEQPDDPT